jgi:hypothetical protein
MNAELTAFTQQGFSDGVAVMGRTVTIPLSPTVDEVLVGTRGELKIDPGQVKPGGFSYKRAFSMRVSNALSGARVTTAVIKPGMAGVDDLGVACKVISYEVAHNSVLYLFGSVHA